MDPLSAFLYFGVPTTVGLIGLAAVKLHEWSAPAEAAGDSPAEESIPAPLRKSSARKIADRYPVGTARSHTSTDPEYAYPGPMLILRKAVDDVRQHSAEGAGSEIILSGAQDITQEYQTWFREVYGPTSNPHARNLTADEIEAFVRWLNALGKQTPANNPQPEMREPS